jgi:hypothetical protein
MDIRRTVVASRWGQSADPTQRGGKAAQKLAIESLRNIANVRVRDTDAEPAGPDTDTELAAIVGVLRGAGTPLAVAEVAERLRWDPDKTASALERGGLSGLLKFSRDGDRTTVALAEA